MVSFACLCVCHRMCVCVFNDVIDTRQKSSALVPLYYSLGVMAFLFVLCYICCIAFCLKKKDYGMTQLKNKQKPHQKKRKKTSITQNKEVDSTDAQVDSSGLVPVTNISYNSVSVNTAQNPAYVPASNHGRGPEVELPLRQIDNLPLQHNVNLPLQHNHNDNLPLQHNGNLPLQHNGNLPLQHTVDLPLQKAVQNDVTREQEIKLTGNVSYVASRSELNGLAVNVDYDVVRERPSVAIPKSTYSSTFTLV